MDDFEETFYTDPDGVQFRVRRSDNTIFTYRPNTEELILLCSIEDWQGLAERMGLQLVPPPEHLNKEPATPT